MKITLIHGQSHKGSTYHVARILAEKIDGEITEIVLPRDFDQMCVGCAQCIKKDEKLCPHYEKLAPITEAIDAADLLIFESPVYVYHVTSAMKALLEHYGGRWIMHRPEESMFKKQMVCIATAAVADKRTPVRIWRTVLLIGVWLRALTKYGTPDSCYEVGRCDVKDQGQDRARYGCACVQDQSQPGQGKAIF